MSESSIQEWGMEDISERSIRTTDKLLEIFKKWTIEYDGQRKGDNQPTPEDLAKIQEFKKNGWI